uniref:Globin domain-containing protein n=1 Tax=Salvator merianae TaxID=96440 RepID=A0A8D0BB99_SALMN
MELPPPSWARVPLKDVKESEANLASWEREWEDKKNGGQGKGSPSDRDSLGPPQSLGPLGSRKAGSWHGPSVQLRGAGGSERVKRPQEYFPHFDLCPGSKDIRHHGQKVVKALDSALKHLDNLHDTLADLSDLHAYNLRVDPVNFKLLAKCFHVTLASQLRAEYNPLVYLAWDKFFHQVACCLSEKYR